ncbi:MAG TPA: hypothetical protein VKO18_16685 [Terriglobia bacterium]|nr:hypothetical protein [Terriglobia bacterium]
MATGPQPPRPPAPPQPPGSGSHAVTIALLIVALIVLVAGIAVWEGVRFLASAVHVQVENQAGGKKEVSIRTPFGSIEVNKDVNEASLGLPIYPGATHIKEQGSAAVNLDIAEEAQLHVLAGRFETPDSLDKVVAFYHDRLGDQVTKYTERDGEGKTVFEMKHDKHDKVVALKNSGDKTVIELVRVSEGKSDAN